MLRSLKRAYDRHSWVKFLTYLALSAAALLLARLTGGFPPSAWHILAQSAPQLGRLISARGAVAFVSFAGLLILSITWAALWLLLTGIAVGLLWHAYYSRRRASSKARNWRRTPLDNLLDSAYDEPQAALAYTSAHAAFMQTAQPLTPPPARRVQPKSKTVIRSTKTASGSGAGPHTRPLAEKDAGIRRPASEISAAPTQRIGGMDSTSPATSIGIGWDVGIARRQKPNEDSVLVQRDICVFRGRLLPMTLLAVADGMGGHADGQVASHLATHSLMQTVLPTIQHGNELTGEFLTESMARCVQLANQDIYRYREEHAVDLGTTLTAALVVETTTCIVNVGDSRTYLYRAGKGLRQITRDHSLVARMVASGEISAEEVYTHPKRNQVYRALGEKEEIQIDWFIEPVQRGDILLLCSDGLWELVRDHEIEKILQRCIADPPQAADALVKAALHRGGADNISVLVAPI